jgi:uncharacterized membrane protein
MINVTIDNKKMTLEFAYEGLNTYAMLTRNKGETIVGSASVTRYHTDTHNKETARKFAIKKLLNNMKYDYNQRSVVWNAYLNRSKQNKQHYRLSATA